MSTPFIGEIRLWAITYAPKGWSLCSGQTLQVNQNQALFTLLNNTFGGDGQTTFGLPNLQGRAPMGANATTPLGAAGGEASHTLLTTEYPPHNHGLLAKAATPGGPTTAVPNPTRAVAEAVAIEVGGATLPANNFGTGPASVPFAGDAVGNNAGGQGHENRQPFLALNYCIALQGIYPSRP